MRRIREALRLHLQAGLSYCEVGRALKISKSAVGKYVSLARVAGVDCAVAEGLTDEELEARLYRPPVARSSHQLAPDFGAVHQELKRPGVTLMLLWEEYASANPLAYKYTSFCVKYREFAKAQQRSMRQVHIAGEKLFVDYAGDTVPVVDASTGEITRAQIFVAVLGASNYTFACATPRQTTEDWIAYLGGHPHVLLHLAAHSHRMSVYAMQPMGGHAYWEMASPSLTDFPAQMRLIEIWDQDNDFLTIKSIAFDYVVDGDPIADAGRTLGVIDYTSFWEGDGRGDGPEHRNV